MSDAASWGAVLGILMKMWPEKVATIMSWTEMFFGLGYTIGIDLNRVHAEGFLAKQVCNFACESCSNHRVSFGQLRIFSSGPAVGSFLYSAGGFKLPFIVVGSIGVSVGVGVCFLIPDLRQVKGHHERFLPVF